MWDLKIAVVFLVVKLELIFVEAYFLFFLYLFVVISSFYNLFSLDHIFVAVVVVLGLWLVAVLPPRYVIICWWCVFPQTNFLHFYFFSLLPRPTDNTSRALSHLNTNKHKHTQAHTQLLLLRLFPAKHKTVKN